MKFASLPPEEVQHCNDLPKGVAEYTAAEHELRSRGWLYLITYDAWISTDAFDALYPDV